MQITATEFKLNLGKYLNLVLTEDIWIPSVDAISGVLAGKVPADEDRYSLREERLSRYETDD